MAERKSLQSDDGGGGVPEWVVTFGDMMSLLLTFFIMLYSMGSLETQRTQQVVEALSKQFGYENSILSLMPGDYQPTNSMVGSPASAGRAKLKDLMNGGDKVKAPVGDNPRVQSVREGEASQSGVVYFKEGSDELSDEAKQKLVEYYRDIAAGKQNVLEIKGHTSAKPLDDNSPFRNHFDLAYARCFRVMEYLVQLGVDPGRIQLNAAGPNEPTHIDGSVETQEEADRVEILLLSKYVSDFRGTPEERRMKYSTDAAP